MLAEYILRVLQSFYCGKYVDVKYRTQEVVEEPRPGGFLNEAKTESKT